MFCPNCGMPHDDWVRFCTECGASMDVVIHPPVPEVTQENAPESAPIAQTAPIAESEPTVDPAQYPISDAQTVEQASDEYCAQPCAEMPFYEETPLAEDDASLKHPVPMGEKPVSLGKWIALLALEMLCSLAHIVLLFVWAFSKNSEKSMQNYARAKLIVIGASVVLAVLLIVVLSVVILTGGGDVSTQLRWYFFH